MNCLIVVSTIAVSGITSNKTIQEASCKDTDGRWLCGSLSVPCAGNMTNSELAELDRDCVKSLPATTVASLGNRVTTLGAEFWTGLGIAGVASLTPIQCRAISKEHVRYIRSCRKLRASCLEALPVTPNQACLVQISRQEIAAGAGFLSHMSEETAKYLTPWHLSSLSQERCASLPSYLSVYCVSNFNATDSVAVLPDRKPTVTAHPEPRRRTVMPLFFIFILCVAVSVVVIKSWIDPRHKQLTQAKQRRKPYLSV
eukprot:TRINITY_DN3734_c0_g1_i1.p1 TRINITY_DN3734_c0_g1~~TRINITY_DN3734_c0_g1_i1.p1  ORF type:complete len:281 (+),score=32.02 TRINITY_DN3734_c0_g1_i1:77-844(+)